MMHHYTCDKNICAGLWIEAYSAYLSALIGKNIKNLSFFEKFINASPDPDFFALMASSSQELMALVIFHLQGYPWISDEELPWILF